MPSMPIFREFRLSRRTMLSAGLTTGAGVLLAGCADAIQIQTQLYLSANKADREKFFSGYVTQFANDDGAWYDLLGDDWMFLSAEDRKAATKDQDSFLKTALGAYLSIKGYRYQDLPENLRAEVSPELFNYYKGHGRAWLKDRVGAPRNNGLKARLKLYYARMNRNAHTVNPTSLRNLLHDDANLTKFLTDNNFATLWVMSNNDRHRTDTIEPPTSRHLGPIVTGILPALGS